MQHKKCNWFYNMRRFICILFFIYALFGQVPPNQEFRVNTYAQDDQRDPCVTNLSDSGFVICWKSGGANSSDIYGQIFNRDGSERGDEFQVNTYSQYGQSNACVTHLSGGRFVVCWESFFYDDSINNGIYCQIYNNAGFRLGQEFRINNDTDYRQGSPSVTNLLNGKFAVFWEKFGQLGPDSEIFGQIFD